MFELDFFTNSGCFTNFQWPVTSDSSALSAPTPESTLQFAIPEQNSTGTSSGCEDFMANDWLLWNQGPSNSIPPLVRHNVETLLRVMKTWPKSLAKGFQTPPMFHFTHVQPETQLPLMANCVSITKMWASHSDGGAEIVQQRVVQEMRSIFEEVRSLTQLSFYRKQVGC